MALNGPQPIDITRPPRSMPAQRPGNSKQDYCTPRGFLNAVEREFGPIVWDLAASKEQRVTHDYFGPDHSWEGYRDALKLDWHTASAMHALGSLLWLNPPYSHIAPWASKCVAESTLGARIAFLVPASIGANWFWDHVSSYARVFSVGRLYFVTRHADGSETPACFSAKGKPTPYPKDLILALFDSNLTPGLERMPLTSAERGAPQC